MTGLAQVIGSPATEPNEGLETSRVSTVDNNLAHARTLVEIRLALHDKLERCPRDIRAAMQSRYESTCRQLEALERKIGADALRKVAEQVEGELQSALHAEEKPAVEALA